jgi:hypothetical protein
VFKLVALLVMFGLVVAGFAVLTRISNEAEHPAEADEALGRQVLLLGRDHARGRQEAREDADGWRSPTSSSVTRIDANRPEHRRTIPAPTARDQVTGVLGLPSTEMRDRAAVADTARATVRPVPDPGRVLADPLVPRYRTRPRLSCSPARLAHTSAARSLADARNDSRRPASTGESSCSR